MNMTQGPASKGILKGNSALVKKYDIDNKKLVSVDPNIFYKLLARQTIYRVSKCD